MSKIQEIVVQKRLQDGYTLFGETCSLLNGLSAFVLVKGKHTLVINSLGYDEHTHGITWKIK